MIDTRLEYQTAAREFHATEGLPHEQRLPALQRYNQAWRAHCVPAFKAAEDERAKRRRLAADALTRVLQDAAASGKLTEEERAAISVVYGVGPTAEVQHG